MAEEYKTWRRAEGKIGIAIRRLVEKYPYHVVILERFKVQARPNVGTMAVTVGGDDVLLLHNPDFVLGTPMAELAGVLLHEVHHVLFRHVLADPADYPDKWARTVAQEVTANEFVGEPLPGKPITLDQFPSLLPVQSTDERYQRLEKRVRRMLISVPGKCEEPQQEAGGSGDKPDPQQTGTASGSKESKPSIGAKGQRRKSGKSRGKAGGETVDDHSVWQEAQQDRQRSEAAVEGIIKEAAMEVGAENIPEALRDALEQMGIGKEAGEDQYELQGDEKGHLDWRHLLRRYVGQLLEVRPTFSRPPRRFPDLVGIVPGKHRRGERPKIMAVVDTSWSITPDLLELMDAELRLLSRHYGVTVVECDAEIHAVYAYRPLESVSGRGGTDFRPPFERKFLQKHRPDLVVFFTDGMGPAPDNKPRLPVVWCLVPGGEAPADWGGVIRIDGPESEQ